MSEEMTENEYRALRDEDVIAYAGPRMKREFEQLIEDRNEWKKLAYEAMTKADELQSENERLRAALICLRDNAMFYKNQCNGLEDAYDWLDELHDIARAALEVTP